MRTDHETSLDLRGDDRWRGRCRCRWQGEWRESMNEAAKDAIDHLEAAVAA